MEWTFDPLEIKNAYFNLERLGAIARRYNINQYGITSSPLQGFLPTDRLVAEWWLKSKRVETLLSTGKHPGLRRRGAGRSSRRDLRVEGRSRTRGRRPQRCSCAIASSSWRRSRAELACLGYERDAQGNGSVLCWDDWDEDWSYRRAEVQSHEN